MSKYSPNSEEAGSSSSLEWQQQCRHFTLAEIQLATGNFDESLVVGRGGFGKVYKGKISNGAIPVVAAIKRLDSMSNQGAIEFWAEVKMLSKLRHCHLVSLIGYCNEGQEMILVYEYMPRGTLGDHLHKHHTSLSCVQRLKICIGAARGLDYLHTGTGITHGVIHRDVKSSNILLDKSWAAKISDFGLSKIGPTNQPLTYVNTVVKGTFGYLDPDYFSTGRLTRKSDVYAFGVVLFEVLTGKRAVDGSLDEEQWGLARWAQDSVKEGRVKQIIDPNLRGEMLPKCLKEFGRLADRCLHIHPKLRPTMAEVVVSLESILAMQEKSYNSMQPAGITIFGRKVPMFLLPSNRENSGRSLEIIDFNFYTVGGEHIQLAQFEFEIIKVATENFSKPIKARGGGSDSMYEGRLPNGQGITVKIFHYDSLQFHEQCRNEVSLLVKLDHGNLVRLLGCCVEGTRMLLVYEFALYASLDYLIFDPVINFRLDWDKRYNILLGVARGLCYLHKHAPTCIVHYGVKPKNILLNRSLDPKISDFGLARSLARSLAVDVTDDHDVNRIHGTVGYTAPEYLSTEADVFSFGVLVLETIGGLMNNRHISITLECFLVHTWTNWWKGTFSNIIDPVMDADSSLMSRYIQIGLLCVQDNASERPTMDAVVEMLISRSSPMLPIPKKPELLVEDWDFPEVLENNHDAGAVEEFISEIFKNDHDTGAVDEFLSELCPR